MSGIDARDLYFLKAAEYVDKLQVYRATCKALLDLAFENHARLRNQEEWLEFMNQLCESIKAWSELDSVGRFMLCDDIDARLCYMSQRLQSEFSIRDAKLDKIGSQATNERVSQVLGLLEVPDYQTQFKRLPPAALNKAMKHLQEAMGGVSPATDHYNDLRTALARLQRADSTANLEVPDLTPNLSNISEEAFAKGGFSDVYTGEWLKQEQVALKVLRMLGGSGAAKRHRLFRKEVKLWHGLRHHHLLQFWGLCDTPHGLAMVSPFMSNGNSSAYLSANPDASTLGLLIGAAYGLEYLHTRNPPITHGDLRGANILVSPSGEAVLADFGLSKIMEVASADSSIGMTTNNAGAARWMAPELFHSEQSEYPPSCASPPPERSSDTADSTRKAWQPEERNSEDRYEGVTPRSDVWAYGMTVYELMTGKNPYHHIKNNATVIVTILLGELPHKPKPTDVRHDWDPRLLDLMHECWKARPSQRPNMSTVSAKVRSIRENHPAIPESLIRAFDTPLSPVSPSSLIIIDEEQTRLREASFIVDSPVSESAFVSQFATVQRQPPSDFNLDPPPIPPSPPRRNLDIKRKSTAGESTVSQGEAKDGLSALPDLKKSAGASRTLRPRSFSEPMAVTILDNPKEVSSPVPASSTGFRSLNSSQVSFGSVSGQSRFSKPSRPVTPATPVPDESSSAPSSPVAKKRQRISSFWKKNSLERAPPDALVTTDPLKTIFPLLNTLIESQNAMLNNTYDATFSTRLRKAGPALVPLDRIDALLTSLLGGYVRLRRQHSVFLKALKSAEDMTASDFVQIIGNLLSQTIDAFSSVYPKYAYAIYAVEEVLAEEMERNFPFRAWLQASEDDVKLKRFLRQPLVSMESIFVSLSQLVAFAKLRSNKDYLKELKVLEQKLVSLLMITRLSKWQGAMGRDDVTYTWRQLVTTGNIDAYADEARQSAIFKIIETQMSFVRILKAFHGGILKRIVQSPALTLPHLQRVYTELTILIDLHGRLLNQMHAHQTEYHPALTEVVNFTFDSVICWADHYNIYSSILFDALDELGRFNADIFPLVHATAHPILLDQDLTTLIWSPINHLRRLSKAFHSLLDVTTDDHQDAKPTVEVISTINKLIELCDSMTSTTGSSPQMRQLATQLQWPSEEDQSLALDDPHRQVVHSGRLLIPQEDSGGFMEIFVIVLDNDLIITIPRMRWGISTLQVLYCIALENVTILDLDTLNGLHDLYLLDGAYGETIAAPLPIRFDTTSLHQTLVLLCLTTAEALDWRRHITSAKTAREEALEAFSRTVLHRQDWITTLPFIPSCSTEFSFNGVKYYLAGGQNANGLWIRDENTQISKQLLTGVSIKQCQVISSMEILLVLSGKSLLSYKLEDIVASKVSSRQIDTKGPVIFFQFSSHKQSCILVVGVSAASNMPVTIRIYEIADTGPVKTRRSSYFGIKDPWSSLFKPLAEFTVPRGLYSCAILDKFLVLLGADGFMFVAINNSWTNLRPVTFPVFRGLASSQTYDRCKTSRPIGVFQNKDLFLLCYADFGIYVNEQGLTQGQSIDWSSEHITQAVSISPHIFLIGRDGIETRLLQSSRLIDRTSGEEITVTHSSDVSSGPERSKLHISMKDSESIRQFELSEESYSIYEWSSVRSR